MSDRQRHADIIRARFIIGIREKDEKKTDTDKVSYKQMKMHRARRKGDSTVTCQTLALTLIVTNT